MFDVTFQGWPFGAFRVVVYQVPVSLASIFNTWYPPDFEKSDFDQKSFLYTWWNSYFFSSLRGSI